MEKIILEVTQKLGSSSGLKKTAEMRPFLVKRNLWLKWKGQGYKGPWSL